MMKRVLRGRQEYADILEERDERAIFCARLMGPLMHLVGVDADENR